MTKLAETDNGGVTKLPRGLPFGGWDVLCAVIIVLTLLVIGARDITTGGLGWSDAPNHTFDGIFVLEFLRALPLDHARQWAEQFYIHSPTLGIIVYWPPGFALVEAVMFAVFGVTIEAARATVLLFAVGAGLLMFHLGRRWFDRSTGLFGALLLITCPHGALWLNDVMLEWPATFWILAAASAYQKDRDAPRPRWSAALAAAIVMAFLTKQTAGFVAPVIVAHALLTSGGRSYVRRKAFIGAMVLAVSVIGSYVLLTRTHSALPAHLLRPSFDLSEVWRWPPEVLGWPMLPLALLGLVTFIIRPTRNARGLLLLWFAVWTAFCLAVSAKEPRYFFFAIPPLAFATVRFFTRPVGAAKSLSRNRGAGVSPVSHHRPEARGTALQPVETQVTNLCHSLEMVSKCERALTWKRDAPRLLLLAALVVTQTVLARIKSTGRLPTYEAAVVELAKQSDADLVLVDAVRDGQFVFDVYQHAGARGRIIPLRASKLLYARAARMKYASQVFVESEREIVALLDRYGIRYIVIESALPATRYRDADPAPRRLLRSLLATDPRFSLVKTWPLRCEDPIWDDVELRLYAYPGCPARTSENITLSFPAMGRDVTFRLP